MEIFAVFILFMSLITLILYVADKKKAIKHQWRVPEKVLLLFSFLGGSIGGLIALYVFRHKNKHWYFVLVNFGSLILHIILGYFIYNKFGLLFI